MILNPELIPSRERLILAGMYLSKFDLQGIKRLGFRSVSEACNVMGYALKGNPNSIKNYRDEFDPLYPNDRKGRRNRRVRDYCMQVYEEYESLDFDLYTSLLESFVGMAGMPPAETLDDSQTEDKESTFAKRLITGVAAERYFESVQPSVPEFAQYSLEDTTRLGCGYDFRLSLNAQSDFIAVEVKGLRSTSGSLLLTPGEHRAAVALGERFYLFVVKGFQTTPYHVIYPNPLAGSLQFNRVERTIVQVASTVRV